MSITEERRRLVSFTNLYYSNMSRFVAHQAARFDPGAAAAREVGAMRGTVASAWLEKNMPEAILRFYRGTDDLLRDLGPNKLDPVFGDEPGLHAWFKNRPGFRSVGPQYSLDEGIGIAVRKEDVELRQAESHVGALKLLRGISRAPGLPSLEMHRNGPPLRSGCGAWFI